MDRNDSLQWQHVCVIKNTADTDNTVIIIEKIKRSDWLPRAARLKQPGSQFPEHVVLLFSSDEEYVSVSDSMIHVEEKKADIQ